MNTLHNCYTIEPRKVFENEYQLTDVEIIKNNRYRSEKY